MLSSATLSVKWIAPSEAAGVAEGLEVVGDRDRVEAAALRLERVAEQLPGTELLGGCLVSEREHRASLDG